MDPAFAVIDPRPTPDPVPCPRCPAGTLETLDLQWTACASCGHRAHTMLVGELRHLQQQDGMLHARLDWVRGQIGADPGELPPPPPPAVDRTTATVLLGGGTALLVIAAIVFTAVTWNRLGALGQLAVVSAIVVASAVGAHLMRNEYRATAQSLAGLSAAIATVGALAAPDLGIGPAWAREDDRALIALTLAGVAVFSALAAWRSRLFAWHVAVVLASAGAITSGLLSWHETLAPHPLDVSVLAVLGSVLLTVALRRRAGRNGWSALDRDVIAVGWLLAVLARVLGLTALGVADGYLEWAGAWLVLGLTALFGATQWAGWRASASTAEAPGGGERYLALIVASVSLSAVPPLTLLAEAAPGTVSVVVVAGAVALLILASLHRAAAVPTLLAAIAMWLLGLLMWLVVGPTNDSVGDEPPLAQIALYLAIVAVALFVVGSVPRSVTGRFSDRIGEWDRWPLLWLGAGLGSFAVWAVIGSGSALEAYTLPSAALLLIAALVTAWRAGFRGPFTVTGAALTVALVPAAFLAAAQGFDGEPPWRTLVVVAIGSIIAVVGGIRRWRSILLFGVGVAVLAAFGQIWAVLDTLPRWVVLGTAGAGLLAAGFRFERMQHRRRVAPSPEFSTAAGNT